MSGSPVSGFLQDCTNLNAPLTQGAKKTLASESRKNKKNETPVHQQGKEEGCAGRLVSRMGNNGEEHSLEDERNKKRTKNTMTPPPTAGFVPADDGAGLPRNRRERVKQKSEAALGTTSSRKMNVQQHQQQPVPFPFPQPSDDNKVAPMQFNNNMPPFPYFYGADPNGIPSNTKQNNTANREGADTAAGNYLPHSPDVLMRMMMMNPNPYYSYYYPNAQQFLQNINNSMSENGATTRSGFTPPPPTATGMPFPPASFPPFLPGSPPPGSIESAAAMMMMNGGMLPPPGAAGTPPPTAMHPAAAAAAAAAWYTAAANAAAAAAAAGGFPMMTPPPVPPSSISADTAGQLAIPPSPVLSSSSTGTGLQKPSNRWRPSPSPRAVMGAAGEEDDGEEEQGRERGGTGAGRPMNERTKEGRSDYQAAVAAGLPLPLYRREEESPMPHPPSSFIAVPSTSAGVPQGASSGMYGTTSLSMPRGGNNKNYSNNNTREGKQGNNSFAPRNGPVQQDHGTNTLPLNHHNVNMMANEREQKQWHQKSVSKKEEESNHREEAVSRRRMPQDPTLITMRTKSTSASPATQQQQSGILLRNTAGSPSPSSAMLGKSGTRLAWQQQDSCPASPSLTAPTKETNIMMWMNSRQSNYQHKMESEGRNDGAPSFDTAASLNNTGSFCRDATTMSFDRQQSQNEGKNEPTEVSKRRLPSTSSSAAAASYSTATSLSPGPVHNNSNAAAIVQEKIAAEISKKKQQQEHQQKSREDNSTLVRFSQHLQEMTNQRDKKHTPPPTASEPLHYDAVPGLPRREGQRIQQQHEINSASTTNSLTVHPSQTPGSVPLTMEILRGNARMLSDPSPSVSPPSIVLNYPNFVGDNNRGGFAHSFVPFYPQKNDSGAAPQGPNVFVNTFVPQQQHLPSSPEEESMMMAMWRRRLAETQPQAQPQRNNFPRQNASTGRPATVSISPGATRGSGPAARRLLASMSRSRRRAEENLDESDLSGEDSDDYEEYGPGGKKGRRGGSKPSQQRQQSVSVTNANLHEVIESYRGQMAAMAFTHQGKCKLQRLLRRARHYSERGSASKSREKKEDLEKEDVEKEETAVPEEGQEPEHTAADVTEKHDDVDEQKPDPLALLITLILTELSAPSAAAAASASAAAATTVVSGSGATLAPTTDPNLSAATSPAAALSQAGLDEHACHILRSAIAQCQDYELLHRVIIEQLCDATVLNWCTGTHYSRAIVEALFAKEQERVQLLKQAEAAGEEHATVPSVSLTGRLRAVMLRNATYLAVMQQGCICFTHCYGKYCGEDEQRAWLVEPYDGPENQEEPGKEEEEMKKEEGEGEVASPVVPAAPPSSPTPHERRWIFSRGLCPLLKELATDCYGNYTVQCLLRDTKDSLLMARCAHYFLLPHVTTLSLDKHGSTVVESLVEFCGGLFAEEKRKAMEGEETAQAEAEDEEGVVRARLLHQEARALRRGLLIGLGLLPLRGTKRTSSTEGETTEEAEEEEDLFIRMNPMLQQQQQQQEGEESLHPIGLPILCAVMSSAYGNFVIQRVLTRWFATPPTTTSSGTSGEKREEAEGEEEWAVVRERCLAALRTTSSPYTAKLEKLLLQMAAH